MASRKVRYHAALVLIAMAGLVPVVAAQNAVGNGRALENSFRVPTPRAGDPMGNSYLREMAFREAIVSGNAPMGMSFRADALPSRFEFRGSLGEDDLFAFRRDSMFSGLAGQGIRGTDALQYQFALTTGGRVPDTLAGQFSYARAGGAERSDDPSQPFGRDISSIGGSQGLRRPADDPDLMVPAIDAGTSLLQPVRSISSYTADHSMQPTLVGVMLNKTTQQAAGQTASPLLGVQMVPLDDLRNPMKLPDTALPSTLGATPIQNDPAATGPGTSGTPGTTGVTKPANTAYDALMNRYRDQAGIATPDTSGAGLPTWAKDMTDIRRLLMGLPSSTQKALGIAPPPAEGDPSPIANQPTDTSTPGSVEGFDQEVLRKIREAGGMTDSLIPTDIPNIDRYSAYMKSAQDLLAKERYFDAEERFIIAMSSRDGDVNASVGRAHSELGAGLFLSAALNLRQLFIAHPEIVGMRYGQGLMPAAGRLDEITPVLRDGIGSPLTAADSGLLLAYVGFQRGRVEAVREGLDALAAHGDEVDQRLATMLRGVWMETGATPAEAPAAPAPGG
ncbi:MAG: hypothetical protein IPJ41_00995 [Phycisphaerales bacterium]|nr:hypothetical protein [Phycisphaerales bacterium]